MTLHHIHYFPSNVVFLRPGGDKVSLVNRKRKRCKRHRTIKEHTGKVTEVCVKLKSGEVKSIPVPATHLDVIEALVIDPSTVDAVGWILDNNNYLWR